MTLGSDPYQLHLGTLGGYVMVYDVRYNTMAQQYKHYTRAPVNSLASFRPNPASSLNLNKSDATSPMLIVSTGAANYEVSLLNLETGSVEVLLAVDDRQTKDNFLGGLPSVPSFMRESVFFESDY
jgi:hypothetical protein